MWKKLGYRALVIAVWGSWALVGVAGVAWAIEDAGRRGVAGQAIDVAAVVLAVVWIGCCIAFIRFFWPMVDE